MHRNRTMRKPISDISGVDFAHNEILEKMLNSEATTVFRKPWHRLERGMRLNRIRAFVDELGQQRSMKDTERASLMSLLTKALDKKVLNSKTAVVYDQDTEKITEIKPLVMHQNAAGEFLFQILEKRNAVTFRKRSHTAIAPAEAND